MFKIKIDNDEIAYLKNVGQNSSPYMVFVGGSMFSRGFRRSMNHAANYTERQAKMWVKKLAIFGFTAEMIKV